MKKILLFLAATALSLGASAQIYSSNSSATFKPAKEVKPEKVNYNRIFVGYGPTRFRASEKVFWDTDGNLNKSEAWPGFELGWVHGWHVGPASQPIYIEGGVNLVLDGKSLEVYDSRGRRKSETGTFGSLEIPVSVTYRYRIGNSKVKIAPYLGLHLKANMVWDRGGDVFDTGDNESASRVQVGMQLGVNFDIKHFYFGVGWDKDFNNIYSYDDNKNTDYSIGTQGARVRIGVVF